MNKKLRSLFCFFLSLLLVVTFSLRGLSQDPNQLRRSYQSILDNFPTSLEQARQNNDLLSEVIALNSGGTAYQYFGEFEKALDIFNEALAKVRQIDNSALEGSILYSLATVHSKLGDIQGIDFLESQLDANAAPQRRKVILKTLGIAYTGDLNAERAIEVWQEYRTLVNPSQEVYDYLASAYSLSSLYSINREYDQAIAVLEEAIPFFQEAEDKTLLAGLYQTIAVTQYHQQKGQQAIASLQKAIDVVSKPEDKIFYLKALAEFYFTTNDYTQALAINQQRWDLAQPLDLINKAFVLEDLSNNYFWLNNLPKALELQQEALAKYQEHGRQISSPSPISLAMASEKVGYLLWRNGRSQEAEKYLREAIELYDQQREEVLGNINLFAYSRDRLNQLQSESSIDAHRLLQQILIEQNKIPQALEISEEGRTKALVDLMAARFAVDAEQLNPEANVSLAELRQVAQRENTTLVQYSIVYEYGRLYRYNFFPRPPAQSQDLLIWVISPQGNIDFRKVKVTEPLEDLVHKARQGVFISTHRLSAAIDPLKALHRVLIEPIAELLPKDPQATVTFIPQDTLFLVPFPALLNSDGQMLIDQHTPITIPSIQVLNLARRAKNNLSPQSKMLVVGNPTMPKVSFVPGEPARALDALPGAEQEAIAIAKLLNTQPILGANATKAKVIAQMEQAKYIHLATHGLLDDFSGYLSTLAFAPTHNDDGFLTTREIFNINLNAELVVLSACDTGRGSEVLFGDGVVGFARSFIGSGVPSLIVSLWAIPDQPTAVLMEYFYQNLNTGMTKAQALREAMLQTRQQYPSPKDWAAFVLVGLAE